MDFLVIELTMIILLIKFVSSIVVNHPCPNYGPVVNLNLSNIQNFPWKIRAVPLLSRFKNPLSMHPDTILGCINVTFAARNNEILMNMTCGYESNLIYEVFGLSYKNSIHDYQIIYNTHIENGCPDEVERSMRMISYSKTNLVLWTCENLAQSKSNQGVFIVGDVSNLKEETQILQNLNMSKNDFLQFKAMEK